MSVIDSWRRGDLYFQLITTTSEVCARTPILTISAPTGTVILGGGAYVDWDGSCPPCPCPPGNMLTGMYPNDLGTTWTVSSKDHIKENKARIVAYFIVARTIPPAYYKVFSAVSMVGVKTMQVAVPADFTVVGGGARALGNTSMLVASVPLLTGSSVTGWQGTAAAHILPDDLAPVKVWAIALKKSFLAANGIPTIASSKSTSSSTNHPKKTYVIPDFHLTGVGASLSLGGSGSLLIASFPEDRQTVVAEGKDHIVPNTATVTAYAVGFF